QRSLAGPDYLVSGLDVSRADDTHVEAGPVVAHQQCGQLWLAQPQADPVAGDPRLSDFELGIADAIPVADAYLVIWQAGDGEVLAELAIAEVVPAEVLLPVPVGLDLVNQDGPLLAAMPLQVALAVTVDVQVPRHPRS